MSQRAIFERHLDHQKVFKSKIFLNWHISIRISAYEKSVDTIDSAGTLGLMLGKWNDSLPNLTCVRGPSGEREWRSVVSVTDDFPGTGSISLFTKQQSKTLCQRLGLNCEDQCGTAKHRNVDVAWWPIVVSAKEPKLATRPAPMLSFSISREVQS